ncbi:iron-sulfur cluster assembly scaffold protein [Candidatus Bipolaricaulota bacterium]|nr:iron-sulfur cluster assembly scaffold protein [Candidatus Bipolaricaulota bacterium]
MNDKKPRIYNQSVLHHSQNPHNKGELTDPDFCETEENPTCGDKITLQVNISEGVIRDIKFNGHGCVLCIGAASILTQMVRGLNIKDASSLTLDDLVDNMGNPAKLRKDCVGLSLNALHEILSSASRRN